MKEPTLLETYKNRIRNDNDKLIIIAILENLIENSSKDSEFISQAKELIDHFKMKLEIKGVKNIEKKVKNIDLNSFNFLNLTPSFIS